MTEYFFLYSLRSALVLALLYIPYMLMLRQESFFRLNRLVLLLILLLSLVLPALDIHTLAWEGMAPVQEALRRQMAGSRTLGEAIRLPEVAVDAAGAEARTPWQWMSLIFVLVMAGVALWRVYQVGQMRMVMRRGSLWMQTRDGVHVYCHADDVSPYSWVNSVVISERDYRENGREILLHETAHVRAHHSLDLLLLALMQTLQWWNPLVYILGGSLRDVHEYEADDSVLRHGVSARAYQLLLIKKVVGSSSYAFANNFDHSLIIKRITMMQKQKSGKWMCSKALYLLPMATLALSAFATVSSSSPAAAAEAGRLAESEGKVSTLTPNRQANALETAINGQQSARESKKPKGYCEKPGVMASFPGGEVEMARYLQVNVRYPAKAQEQGVQGRVLVQFYVLKDGTVSDVHVLKFMENKPKDKAVLPETTVMTCKQGDSAGDAEVTEEQKAAYEAGVKAIEDEAVRVVKGMPKWTPAYEDKAKTRPCATQFMLPLTFRLG